MVQELKCFISTPANTDTSVLRRILREHSVDAYDAYDFQLDQVISDNILDKIKRADFAIIVLSEQDLNVLYEMGVCDGMKKPILVIVSKELTDIPYFVQNHIHLRSELTNNDLLNITVSKFIEEVRQNRQKLSRKFLTKPSQKSSEPRPFYHYLEQIQELRESGEHRDLENLVSEVFSSLSLQSVPNQFANYDRGADFAVWSDKLSTTTGNPILIEIKAGNLTPQRIREAEDQLQEYLAKSGAKVGILLYLDRNNRRFLETPSSSPLIIKYDIEDFLREIIHNTFEDFVLTNRNRIVHGRI
jgi:hypothetical protein